MPEEHRWSGFLEPSSGYTETELAPHVTCVQLTRVYGLLGLPIACAETSHICEICQMWGFYLILHSCKINCIWGLKKDIFISKTREDQMFPECWKRWWQERFPQGCACLSRPRVVHWRVLHILLLSLQNVVEGDRSTLGPIYFNHQCDFTPQSYFHCWISYNVSSLFPLAYFRSFLTHTYILFFMQLSKKWQK